MAVVKYHERSFAGYLVAIQGCIEEGIDEGYNKEEEDRGTIGKDPA